MSNRLRSLVALALIALVAVGMWPQSSGGNRGGSGGTGNAFFTVSGPAGSAKIFTFQNASSNVPSIVGASVANALPKFTDTSGTVIGSSSITDNGTTVVTTEAIGLPDGTCGSAPALFFNSATATGLCISGAVGYGVTAGIKVWGWHSSTGFLVDKLCLNIALGDACMTYGASNTVQLGLADVNGSAVAQTLQVQSSITGTNVAGAAWSLKGSAGTGNATAPLITIYGAESDLASGTTAQVKTVRLVLNDTKALTSGAATTLLSIPLPTLAMAGGTIVIHMEATDGTNQCTLDDVVTYAGENSAAVFVVNTSKMGTGANACTATKTLTATYALTGANPALLQVTPTLGGITATRFAAVYEVHHQGNTQPTP